MDNKFENFIENTFALPENEGENKVMDLKTAVARHIHPGANIHIAVTHCCSYAAVLEIARRFHGSRPDFTLIMRGIRDTVIILLHMGLIKRVITAFSGNVYPWYGPNPVCQKAYAEKNVELEEWSILTFPLMLMAGALGVPAMPTNSLLGSSLAETNNQKFTKIDDPFGTGRSMGLVKALNPDISIVHGAAADREGNTILTAPYSESLWGAKASKGGVLVTVEKIVSTEFIRRHAHLVKLPAYMVKSVSEVSLGAHPGGVWHQGLQDFEPYGEDYKFMTEFNKACKDTGALDKWIENWVLNCPAFEDYRAKLGAERILSLKGSTHRDAWRFEEAEMREKISENPSANVTEQMVVIAARIIREKILKAGHRTMLAGAGTANLAAWLAKYQLKDQGHIVELMVELGYFGNSPRPSEPFLLNFGNFSTCKMLTETTDTLGVFTGGATNRCLGVLGAAQIDQFGNINSSWVSENMYVTGSGGANDVATGACETMMIMRQSKRRFLEKVPFITAPGSRISTLVSDMGVFEKTGDDDTFTLTRVFADPGGADTDETVERIRDKCGWHVKTAGDLQVINPPEPEELRLLRVFDPHRYYLK